MRKRSLTLNKKVYTWQVKKSQIGDRFKGNMLVVTDEDGSEKNIYIGQTKVLPKVAKKQIMRHIVGGYK